MVCIYINDVVSDTSQIKYKLQNIVGDKRNRKAKTK
jgi:hypothetical protein